MMCILLSQHQLQVAPLIIARKRSLGQGNIFTPVCHSVHGGLAWLGWACMVGVHAWLQGGMHDCGGDMHDWGHAWLLGGVCGCQGVCGCSGACVVVGGMHGCRGHASSPGGAWLWGGVCGSQGACMVAGGCAWLPGACMVGGVCVVVGGCVCRIRQDTVNEWAVRILLECILVCETGLFFMGRYVFFKKNWRT